ncbi:uncharacterized protein EI97DRAFT_351233, partial [Westerdykella ornata]
KYPYEVGRTFLARKHTPPEPFGGPYDTVWPPEQEGWKTLTQTEYCLSRPPLPGTTNENHMISLKIESLIRTGENAGAQIVGVSNGLVAKIFDPLYYDGKNDHGFPADVVIESDGDYSREAAAYSELQGCLKAMKHIPKYYGSWTTEIETCVGHCGSENTEKRKREVRLILMEMVEGIPMTDINPLSLAERLRHTILIKVFEAKAQIYSCGVSHNDLSLRNIFVIANDLENLDVDITIIDFNIAGVTRKDWLRNHFHKVARKMMLMYPGRLLSPIPRFWDKLADFSAHDWLPDDAYEASEWLWRQFYDNNQYLPVVRNPRRPTYTPRMV